MEKVRCLVAGVRHYLLADIIRNILDRQPKVEIIKHIENVDDVSEFMRHEVVDILILDMDKLDTNMFDKLFELSNTISIIGIINDGRRLCLYKNDVGPEDLASLIKMVINRNKNS